MKESLSKLVGTAPT